jgi:hypothetical protein
LKAHELGKQWIDTFVAIHLEMKGSIVGLTSVYFVHAWALLEWIIVNDVRPWVSPCHEAGSAGYALKPRVPRLMLFRPYTEPNHDVDATPRNEGNGVSGLLFAV